MKLYCIPRGELDGSAAVYSLLAFAVRTEYGIALPGIQKTPNGKPYFRDRQDIHFSLSHTVTHVLCAVSDAPVGVDIESPRIISERAVKYFCTPEERLLFEPLDLWVLKESFIKLTGETLPAIKKLRFSRRGSIILTPCQTAVSKLYTVDVCRAAVSAFSGELPASITLLSGLEPHDISVGVRELR